MADDGYFIAPPGSQTEAHLDQLRQQTTLAKFGELALKSDDLDEILTEACRLAGEALGTHLAKVVQLQPDGRTMVVRAGVGWQEGVIGHAIIVADEDTSEGHALRTGEPMTSPDIATETRFKYADFLVENGVKAVANVLIIGASGQPPFGILQIDSRQPRNFTPTDTAFLQTYANLLAAAVDRLRVLGEVRSTSSRLVLAMEIGELGSWDLNAASGEASHSARQDQIFGYTDASRSWSFETFLDHVILDDRAAVRASFDAMLNEGCQWHIQCRIVRSGDNALRWIEVRGKPDGASGNRPRRILSVVQDITDRKATEAALQHSNEVLEKRVRQRTLELTAANASLEAEASERERIEAALRQSHKMEAVGQLTGGLAHDFNNLLTGIIGSLELMRKRIVQGRVAELDRYIETAMGAANRAAALTHRLLAFSRRQTLDPKAVNASRLVGGMAELFQRTVGPAIKVETRLDDALWLALCDPNQLENALLNLVINAKDAMPDGGHLLITTKNVDGPGRIGQAEAAATGLPNGSAHGHVMLAVSDTGTGMPPDVIERAFDPFFTTKPTGLGTGLGLSMIYGFVQQSGGHVQIESVEGKGSTVTIFLPRHEGQEAAETAAGREAPSITSKAAILVVEDEPAVRTVVVEALSDIGYTIVEACDGPSGLRGIQPGAAIDLLITDVGLPGGMNGRQLADAARQRRPGLKVLFITGYAESVAVGNGLMEPGMEVLVKPFDLGALTVKVQAMLSNTGTAPTIPLRPAGASAG